MAIFALSDLHLPGTQEKPMDIFGPLWENHPEKIEKNWCAVVKEQDTVLVPGDISWAKTEAEAKADLDFLAALPGKKVLLRGNHDYWWSSVSRLRRRYPALQFLQNDALLVEEVAVCGCRGWVLPGEETTKEDEKIYRRELERLRLSLTAAKALGGSSMLAMFHFPPLLLGQEETAMIDLLQQSGVQTAVFGHIHGTDNFLQVIEGRWQQMQLHLVSADYLDFMPKLIWTNERNDTHENFSH